MQLYKEGRYIEAIKEFIITLEQHKDNHKMLNDAYEYICKIHENKEIKYGLAFFDWLKQQIANGNSYANTWYGMMLAGGNGVDEDVKEAVKFFMTGVSKDNLLSYYYLAMTYYMREEVGINIPEAIRLCKFAVDKGITFAMNMLGTLYVNEQNYPDAIKLFRQGVELGDAVSMFNLAHCYYHGNGVAKNDDEVIKLLKMSHDHGYDGADKNLKSLLSLVPIKSPMFTKLYERYFENERLKQLIEEQDELIDELQTELDYRPGGVGYVRAKESAENTFEKIGKS